MCKLLPCIKLITLNSLCTISHRCLAIPLVSQSLQTLGLTQLYIGFLLSPWIILRIEHHTKARSPPLLRRICACHLQPVARPHSSPCSTHTLLSRSHRPRWVLFSEISCTIRSRARLPVHLHTIHVRIVVVSIIAGSKLSSQILGILVRIVLAVRVVITLTVFVFSLILLLASRLHRLLMCMMSPNHLFLGAFQQDTVTLNFLLDHCLQGLPKKWIRPLVLLHHPSWHPLKKHRVN